MGVGVHRKSSFAHGDFPLRWCWEFQHSALECQRRPSLQLDVHNIAGLICLLHARAPAAVTLSRVAGYRRSSGENNDAQLSAQTCTLRIRQRRGFDFSSEFSTSPLRAAAILTLSDFH